jgi:diguanylate cyclase (GGDEF)-like protein/PAS domain S-box-containing protein
MNLLSTSLFAIQLIAAALSSASAAVVWRRRQTPGAIPLALLLLSVSAWNAAFGLKSLASNLAQFSFLAKLEIIGQVCTATLFLIFILEYTRRNYLLAERRALLLWIIPFFSILLALSNDAHHIFWLAAEPGNIPGQYIFIPGDFYWVHNIYYYLTRLISTILLILAILRYPASYRLQAAYLLAGTIAIWLANIIDLPQFERMHPAWGTLLHPIAYAISGLIIAWGIFRHKLFDLVPIAHDIVFNNMLDGIIALDTNRRVVDINLAARYLLQINKKKQIVGVGLDELLENLPEVRQRLSKSDMPFQDIYIPHPTDLTLEVMSTPILDSKGQSRGTLLVIHDISIRVRSEAAMRQSEENLRTVFENAPFPIIVTSLNEDNILYLNPAGQKMYNVEKNNIKDLFNTGFYQDTDGRQKLLEVLKKTDSLDNIELSLQTSDNKPLWAATSARHITYNGEKAILITQVDISEQRRNIEELRQSRAQLRNIFEHADAGIYLLDPTGSITFSNERWAQLLNEPAGDLIDKNLSDYIFKSDVPYSRHLFESLIGGEIEKYSLELRYTRLDGNVFWGALSAIPIFGENNEIQSIVNFVSDITLRKQTENALRETERRFREILEKIYLFAVMLDTEGNITFCNEHLLAATNWTSEEIFGDNWFDVFLAQNSTPIKQEYKRAIQQGTIVSRHENEILTSNGKRLLVDWSNILLRDANGKVTGSASIGEDITERRRAQQSEMKQRMFAEALYDTAAAITSTLNFEEVLDRILENLDAAVKTDSANISLIKQGKVHFVRAKGYDKYGVSNEDILKLNFSLSNVKNLREMYQSKEPLCISDTRAYPGWKATESSKLIRSYIGVPIIVKEKVAGFISVDSATPGFFSQDQAERLRAFSLQAAIAIENTRLYTNSLHELEERKRTQARLRRANKKLKIQLEQIEALQAELREQAIRDALTGIFNRRYLEEILPEKIKQCRQENLPLSLMMIDIDHFKTVNDSYGHQAGDIILQYLGNLFQRGFDNKGIACRYGGEEFVIVLPGISMDEAYEYADKLRQDFSEYRLASGKNTIQATVSIGIANLRLHGQDGHSLLVAADNALYQAKQAGRNCVKIAE